MPGLPALLLHGFTGSPQSFTPLLASPWNPPLVPFAPALPGHASTECPGATEHLPLEGFEDAVEALHQRSQRLGFRRGGLLGYSLGARLGLGLLTRHPESFEWAVLIGVHPGISNASAREERRDADAQRAAQLRSSGLEPFIQRWEASPLFRSQRSLPKTSWQRQARIRRSHSAEGLALSLESCGLAAMPDYLPLVGSINCPVLLLTGERDTKFEVLARQLAASLKRAEHVQVERCGHNPILEAPDRVARHLKQWLRDSGLATD